MFELHLFSVIQFKFLIYDYQTINLHIYGIMIFLCHKTNSKIEMQRKFLMHNIVVKHYRFTLQLSKVFIRIDGSTNAYVRSLIRIIIYLLDNRLLCLLISLFLYHSLRHKVLWLGIRIVSSIHSLCFFWFSK